MRALIICFLLAVTSAASQPVFQYTTHEGLKGIIVGGKNLLTGCGHGFIGSYTGSDNPDNISSCHAGGTTMLPLSNTGDKRLPHKLYYRLDESNPSRLHFGGEVGISSFDFATVSMPMDAHKSDFTHFRSSTEPNNYRKYADIPFTYTANNDPNFRVSIHPSYFAEWGEIISPNWTLRYTVYGATKPMRLYFVNHPDTRNVEFSFGRVRTGEKFNVMGSIEVVPTSTTALTAMGIAPQGTYYAGSSSKLYHNIGRQDGQGWSANVLDRYNEYMVYGPYDAYTKGTRKATFSIALDNVTNDNNAVATIEVFNASSGTVVAKQLLRRRDFNTPFAPKNFTLVFNNAGGVYEHRVMYHGSAYLKLHSVTID